MKERIYDLGVFLVERLKLDQPGEGKQGLHQEILALYDGEKGAVKEYYVRKVLIVLAVLAAGLLLSGFCFLAFHFGGKSNTLNTVLRPGYGEGDRTTELSVKVEEDNLLQEMEILVSERKYTEQEKRELLNQALLELEETLPGENASLDFVQKDLVFSESFADGAVSAAWTTSPYDVIGEDGKILLAEEEEGILVEIQAVLTCEEREAAYTACVNVFPPEMTEEEHLLAAIEKEVARADEESRHESSLILPGTVEGKALTWLKGTENPFFSVLALTLITTCFVYLRMDSRIHEKAQKRKDQLILDYPDLMWKITMLLGAGMSLRSVFTRIAEEYVREQKKRRPRYAYEEILHACNEMQSGIGEAQAYERFGKRCQLPEYIRIGSIFSQNLRKGAKGLTVLLESEAEASLNDRKNHARKIGEQAGTRLLLPMGLMLGIVLAVLMVPAFLSM